MLVVEKINQYYGKKIQKVTDVYGVELADIHMVEGFIIHFDDGSSIRLGADGRGCDCYVSQYENK